MNNIIKDIRKQLGLTQREISYLLNIKQCTWSNYETKKRNISLKIAYKLIKIAKLKGIETKIEVLKPE